MSEPARCLGCFYVLEGLPEPRCPECGRVFDPQNPATFTTKPPFVWWRYWLPGFSLAAGLGFILYATLVATAGWAAATTLVLPFSIGTIIGYACRVRRFFHVLLALTAITMIVLGLFSLSLVGVFCGLVLAGAALGPLVIGTLCGVALREMLKRSRFDQRRHLPLFLLLLVPALWAIAETASTSPRPLETVVTVMDIPAALAPAWHAVMFYEEVRHDPPWLLRLGLPRPLYSRGRSERPGDTKICIYSKGRLTKRVTAVTPLHRLDFAVIEQIHIENHDVRLTGGSFAFEALDASRTRVTLTTEYQPLLGPRWVWRPFECLAVHTLHRHVLEGMREKAIASGDLSAAEADPQQGSVAHAGSASASR